MVSEGDDRIGTTSYNILLVASYEQLLSLMAWLRVRFKEIGLRLRFVTCGVLECQARLLKNKSSTVIKKNIKFRLTPRAQRSRY